MTVSSKRETWKINDGEKFFVKMPLSKPINQDNISSYCINRIQWSAKWNIFKMYGCYPNSILIRFAYIVVFLLLFCCCFLIRSDGKCSSNKIFVSCLSLWACNNVCGRENCIVKCCEWAVKWPTGDDSLSGNWLCIFKGKSKCNFEMSFQTLLNAIHDGSH